MGDAPLYRRIVSGEAGFWAVPARAGLWAASCVYSIGIRLRNRSYDSRPARTTRLPFPVISVGNITAGGTGKTPMVIDLVRRLRGRGRRPAVVARGYKSRHNRVADELVLVRRRAGAVIAVAAADRVSGGIEAIEQGADVIVLDDAFQHRRIHRDLDLVMIDATCPLGHGHVLPRGLLREPLSGLARADLMVLSRTDAVPADRIDAIVAHLRRYNAAAPILRSRHRAAHVTALTGECVGLETLRDRRVLCVAGIGNPDAFVQTVARIGAVPVGHVRLPDHAPYDAAAYRALSAVVDRCPDAEYVVTTEKDLVKLEARRWSAFPLPIAALAINIDLAPRDDTMLEAAVDRLIQRV